jgi:two-component system cell cycle sensor histidine kinase/response regulator CckA
MPKLTRSQGVCLAYFALHMLSHVSARWFEVQPGVSVSIWYPPSGLALALLVLLGPRYAPVVFAANFAAATLTPNIAWPTFFFPAMITGVYAGTAWWVRRRVGLRLLPGEAENTFVFCTAIVGAPLIAATIGVLAIQFGGLSHAPLTTVTLVRSIFAWWIGDASGLLTVVPIAMVFVGPWLSRQPGPPRTRRFLWSEWVVTVARWLLLVGTLLAVLAVPALREHSAFYICFLPLVWICVHHGLPGATVATLVLMLVGLVGMRLLGTTVQSSYIFLLFEVAVAGVGLGLGTLVTRRAEAERRLAASEAQLDRAIAGSQLGLWDWNLPANRLDSNRRLAEMLGYSAEEMPALTEGETTLLHPADRARVSQEIAAHLEGKTGLYEADYRLRAKDGQWRWIHARGSVVSRDAQGRPLLVSGTHLDITHRKRAEAEVGRLLRIIEATPDFILTTDPMGRLIFANAALLTLWGAELAAVVGRELAELFPGEGGSRLHDHALPAALAAGAWQGEVDLSASNGRTIPTSQVVLAHRDEQSDAFAISFVMRDLSDQRRAEAERIEHQRDMLQLQKTESLVVLAGGIAHDFNNLLTAVVCNTNLARLDLPSGAPAQALLANVEQAAARAAALCHQMLAYAGTAPVAFTELDLSRLVEDAIQLVAPGLNKKIAIELALERPISLVLGATTQLQQLAMNLALNGAEAIGDAPGRLTLRTRSGEFSTRELAELVPGSTLPAGAYALLEVADTGCGMTPEIQARIFEPFFTTKFAGQGLGLSAVIGIAKSHRGAIAVRSAPGAGTLFRLALPALSVRAAPPPVSPPAEGSWRGSGVVLLVDDDPLIRKVTTQMLGRLGFEALLACDGIEGVEAFRAQAGRIRCVLLDLTMPRMDGFEAHAAMHRIDAAVPVILMSGYSQRLSNLPPEAIHPAAVMAKPFGLDQLRARLRAVLESAV